MCMHHWKERNLKHFQKILTQMLHNQPAANETVNISHNHIHWDDQKINPMNLINLSNWN